MAVLFNPDLNCSEIVRRFGYDPNRTIQRVIEEMGEAGTRMGGTYVFTPLQPNIASA